MKLTKLKASLGDVPVFVEFFADNKDFYKIFLQKCGHMSRLEAVATSLVRKVTSTDKKFKDTVPNRRLLLADHKLLDGVIAACNPAKPTRQAKKKPAKK